MWKHMFVFIAVLKTSSLSIHSSNHLSTHPPVHPGQWFSKIKIPVLIFLFINIGCCVFPWVKIVIVYKVLRTGPYKKCVTASLSVKHVFGFNIPYHKIPQLWLGRGGDWTQGHQMTIFRSTIWAIQSYYFINYIIVV